MKHPQSKYLLYNKEKQVKKKFLGKNIRSIAAYSKLKASCILFTI
jgi:hypothetical protein